MDIIFQILTLLGSLGLFLYGMTLMSEALQKVAGQKLRSILVAMTSSPLKRVFTGALITAIIQSSSATTVMVVSFVNAGLLTLTQSIGVIMGANIGTTITAWVITLLGFKADVAVLSIPLIGLGFMFMMFKSKKRKDIGALIIGFALLFLGLSFLKNSVPDIGSSPEILAFLQTWTDWGFASILIFVGIGTVLTIVLQSSSATMALTLVMCNFGWIPFEMAAAMVLGENIGTTITANIAASIANVSARRAARGHLLFNIFGVTWMLILFNPMLDLVSKIIVMIGGVSPLESTTSVLISISLLHTLFNVINTSLLIWFTPQIVKCVCWMVKSPEEEEVFRLKYIQAGLMNTSELSLTQAKQELVHFGTIIKRQFVYAREAINNADNESKFDKVFKKLEHYEQISDNIELEIAKYLNGIGEGDLGEESGKKLHSMYKIIGELESIGDSGFNIGRILQRKNLLEKKFDEGVLKKLNHMMDLVDTAIDSMIYNLENDSEITTITNAEDAEYDINEYRGNLKQEHLINVKINEDNYITGIYYMDIVSECERVGDFLINVSEAIIEVK